MKSIILYYSYSGTVKKLAEALAKKTGADIYEILDYRRPGKLKVFFSGCPRAIRGLSSPIQRISADLSQYSNFIVMAPVWASNPAPPINNLFNLLRTDASISLFLVSSSGNSSKARVLARFDAAGYRNVEYMDIKRTDK